jgi:hypothetical protein
MKRWTMAIAPLLFLGVLASCVPGTTAPQTMEVRLNGENEVPPVTTDASGSANVTVAVNVMTVDGAFEGFAATAAHVHGPADVNGTAGPIHTLAVDNANTEFGATFTLTAEQVQWFEDGLLYINLHSAANPDGEIRGQIVP